MAESDGALLVLRVALGGIYLAHGFRKAFGWGGGPGWRGWTLSIERRGFRPYQLWAIVGIAAELIGGPLAILGLLTPLAGALLLAESIVIVLLLAPRGFWSDVQGIEYPIVLTATALAVVILGPGAWSLDRALGVALPGWFPAAMVILGVVGALAPFATKVLGGAASQPAQPATQPAQGPETSTGDPRRG